MTQIYFFMNIYFQLEFAQQILYLESAWSLSKLQAILVTIIAVLHSLPPALPNP